MKSKIIAMIAFFLSSAFLYGCHTTQGFGQDLEIGGKSIQKAASQDNTDKSSATTTN